MNNKDNTDFPFNLFGIKKEEELTEAQKIGKRLLEIAKQHKT